VGKRGLERITCLDRPSCSVPSARPRYDAASPCSGADAPEALQAVRGYEDVRRCLRGAPMGFYIGTRDSFQVSGSRSGFEHGVIVDQTSAASSTQRELRRPRVARSLD
jgi:hypothetical protein